MAHDTQAINKERQDLSTYDEIWLFGYGSLIYKVDFPFLYSEPAYIEGWVRRFWQGSHDHRGTPENPGRVLTLIEQAGCRCFGRVFKVTHDVFEHLDHREKNGYLRYEVDIKLIDSGNTEQGLVYIAPPDNSAFLGQASEEEIAEHIARSHGPSGENRDYVLELANALREYGEEDAHVFSIEQHLNSKFL